MASFSLGRASALLASGTLVSRILGFVMALLSAWTIGVVGSRGADAFTTANLLPNTIYSIIAGGALNAVLVPQIVRAGLHADGGRRYIDKLITLALGLLLVTTIAATVLAPMLVLLYAPGYGEQQYSLAVAFALWCLPQIFFYGLYTILGEVLNARGSFGPFTWAPVLNNLVAIAGLLAFNLLFGPAGDLPVSAWTPAMIAVLAGSATLGIAVQALFLTFFWRRVGLRYRPDFRFRGVGLGAAGRMALWSFATVLLSIAAGIVESAVSSGASAEGGAAAAALQKSWLVFMLPHSVIAVSIATAYFTKMSGHAARGELAEFRSDVSSSIRTVGLFIVFATVALLVVAVPFGSLFNRGSYEDAEVMGSIIRAYVVVLPLFSSLAIMQRAFYALSDGVRPFLFTLVQVVVVIAGSLAALALPAETTAIGIAAATAFSILCQAAVAAVLLRTKLAAGGGRTIVTRFAQFALAALPAAVVGWLVLTALGGTTEGGFAVTGIVSATVSMAVIGGAMGVVYLTALWLLRVPELRALAAPVLRRLGR